MLITVGKVLGFLVVRGKTGGNSSLVVVHSITGLAMGCRDGFKVTMANEVVVWTRWRWWLWWLMIMVWW